MSDLLGQSSQPVTVPYKYAARPTTYNGIEMRSGLEGRYAAWLDTAGATWEYEPRRYATEWGDYLPDFRLSNVDILGAPRTVYVELKPTKEHAAAARHQIKVIWASEPDAFLVIEANGLKGPVVFFPPDLHTVPTVLSWARTIDGRLSLVFPLDATWKAA